MSSIRFFLPTPMGLRSLCSKLLAIDVGFTLFVVIHTTSDSAARLSQFSLFGGRRRGTCPPESYADGEWGCASSREYYWHLASENKERWDRFPDVNSWRWQPDEKGCAIQDMQQEDLLRELVEQSGWLLPDPISADSITEGHFFSLSCMLYPHIRATPITWKIRTLTGPGHKTYLDLDSPSGLTLPDRFSIARTPLVTFRRVDLLLEKQRLVDLDSELYTEPANLIQRGTGVVSGPSRIHEDIHCSSSASKLPPDGQAF
ncbi:hypothetical protein C8R44DRAFT_918494 [Mycena epipterygia]|nr:hypothetical protein C8R44DRAFT_918494 [Mycena epipterygia]